MKKLPLLLSLALTTSDVYALYTKVSEEIPDKKSFEMFYIPKVCSDYGYKQILHRLFYRKDYETTGSYSVTLAIAACEPDGKKRAEYIKKGLDRETQEHKKATLYMMEGDAYYTDNWSKTVNTVRVDSAETISSSDRERFLKAKKSYLNALESVMNNPSYPIDNKKLDAYYEIETGLVPRAIATILYINLSLGINFELDSRILLKIGSQLDQLRVNIVQESRAEKIYESSIDNFNKELNYTQRQLKIAYPELKDEDETEAALEDNETEAALEDNETEAVLEDDETEAALEDNETEAVLEDDETEAALEDDETEAVLEDNETEAALEDDETEAALEDDETEAALEDDETEAALEDNETEAALEDDETEAALEDDETEAALEDDETEAALEDDECLLCPPSHRGNAGRVELLLKEGANVNATDEDSNTPLILASGSGGLAIAIMLLAEGAGVNAVNKDGETALLRAASFRIPEIVEVLIDNGADVNAADKDGMTALMWAANKDNERTVKMLIEAGVNLNAKDKKGWTAIDWAEDNAKSRMVRIIKAAADKQ